MNLHSLLKQFQQLQETGSTIRAKAWRGLAFERLLSDLFHQQGILMTEPFRISGEQIDGAFEFKGWTYLVEAKWQNSKKSTNALYSFQGKPDRRIEGTRGLFISMSGYYTTSVNRFAEGRKPNTILWSGEHIKAVLEGKISLQELINASIRFAAERSQLLIPIATALSERTDHLFEAVLEASAAQIDAEISATIGRKFIPKLYVERSTQKEIKWLIHPECELDNIYAELSKTGIRLPETNLKPLRPISEHPLITLSSILDSVRSQNSNSQTTKGALSFFLSTLPKNPMGRIHIITSRAGMGKTNLLCHLAKFYAKQQPTIFLTGRSGITEDTTIKSLIESKITQYLHNPLFLYDNFLKIVSIAKAKNTSVLIIIDALNEHKDYDIINTAISHFLYEVSGLPVVILASCRDVYWPFFDTSLWPALQWKVFDRQLDVFTTTEAEKAITAYFDFYHIVATLTKESREKLNHPLILRFFCEAYGNPSSEMPIHLGEICDIRLKVLFDEYLKRKLDTISHTTPQRFRTPHAIQEFLFRLSDQMRTLRRRDVPREEVKTVTDQQSLESPESVYVSILGEDIMLEEEPDAKNGQIHVVFTYDEFMEYMIARSMLRKITSKEKLNIKVLVDECQNGSNEFQSFVGVLEYLAVILKEEWQTTIWEAIDVERVELGGVVWRAIGKLGIEYVGEIEINALRILSKSKNYDLRLQSVQQLRLIVSSERFSSVVRRRAVDVLLDILRNEDDVVIRSEAVECFEKGSVDALYSEAHKFVKWWERKRDMAHTQQVLFSEDQPIILHFYKEVFLRLGWGNLVLCKDAEDALRCIAKCNPALVVTDMNKPRMSGYELAIILKAKPATQQIPILLASAVGLGGRDDEDCRRLFCGVIYKPFSSEEIVSLVEVAIIGKYTG